MDTTTLRTAWLLGLAGLLPFAACALGTFAAPDAWQGFARGALIGYGAVVLSFLGAVHWGLALRAPPEELPSGPGRLLLGVVPAVLGWFALLLPDVFALPLLAVAILATAGVEQWARGRGLVPGEYLLLRWVLSLGAALCLITPFAH
ncbi:MAG: hypothetical protein JWR10_4103 [Rubritepida sp.]|nr:hypothetical protein [Rubritepida sp.]